MEFIVLSLALGALIAWIESMLRPSQITDSSKPQGSHPQTASKTSFGQPSKEADPSASSESSNPFDESVSIGGNPFRFRHLRVGAEYLIYATSYPANPNRSRCPSKTHIYADGKICTSKSVTDLAKARAIARYWATGYLAYLETGVFPDAGSRVQV